MSTQPIDILQSMAGFANSSGEHKSYDRPIKQAIIDPAYDADSFPLTLPKVIFDNETELSTKFYPVASPYWPSPSQRVWMVPIGTTYLIVGPNSPTNGRLYVPGLSHIRETRRRVSTNRVITNSGNVTAETQVQSVTALNLKAGRWYDVAWRAQVGTTAATVNSFTACIREDDPNGTSIRRKRVVTEGAGFASTVYEVEISQEWQAPSDIASKVFVATLVVSGTGSVFRSVPNAAEAALMTVDYVRGG